MIPALVEEVQILCKIVEREAEASKQYPRVSEHLCSVAKGLSKVLQQIVANVSSSPIQSSEFEKIMEQTEKELSYLSTALKDPEPVGIVKMVVHATVHREKMNRSVTKLQNFYQRLVELTSGASSVKESGEISTQAEKVTINKKLANAARDADLASVKAFVESGADVDGKDVSWYGFTAMHWAASCGSKDIALFLISQGADLNPEDNEHETPLHEACQKGFIDLVALLLEAGASTDVQNISGNTPLHFAALMGRYDVAVLLVEKGASLGLHNKEGRSATEAASSRGHYNVSDYLRGKEAELGKKVSEKILVTKEVQPEEVHTPNKPLDSDSEQPLN